METEEQICIRYEAHLAAIAALDRHYYRIPCPTLAERREYAARQVQLEELRSQFYVEFQICHQASLTAFHCRCRSLNRKPRRS
jgi:hypothetical protein